MKKTIVILAALLLAACTSLSHSNKSVSTQQGDAQAQEEVLFTLMR